MDIKSMIARYREEHGVSRAEMARRVSVPTSTLQDWEISNTRPRIDNFLKLIAVTGTDLPSTTAPQASTRHQRKSRRVIDGDAVAQES